jgi:nitroimidazol reductase NimA-like FMN-containing flavoprotein (pyridoxamine 5'-phosphate oxidase superfamily)
MTNSPIPTQVGVPHVVLDHDECWQLLGRAVIGRLAMSVAGDVDIFPVNYLVDEGTILFRTAEGTKLVEVVIAGRVAFEVDGLDPAAGEAWSVVVKGHGEVLDEFDDIYHAQELPLHPWNAPDQKQRFVRVVPDHVTGRKFRIEVDG